MEPISLYASEIRRARETLSLTQEQLAQAVNYSQSLVAQVEGDRKPPSKDFTKAADEALRTDGLLQRIREHSLTRDGAPEWIRSWYDLEREATSIWWFELSLIPGLTRRYSQR